MIRERLDVPPLVFQTLMTEGATFYFVPDPDRSLRFDVGQSLVCDEWDADRVPDAARDWRVPLAERRAAHKAGYTGRTCRVRVQDVVDDPRWGVRPGLIGLVIQLAAERPQ
jgi:hypothetical protein